MPQRAKGKPDAEAKSDQSGPPVQVIRLTWASDEGIETFYVNQVHISHLGPEFMLVFGEAHLPPRSPHDTYEDEIPIRPVVRLAIAPDAMTQIRDVIDRNVDTYLARGESE